MSDVQTVSVEEFKLGKESCFTLYQFIVHYNGKDFVKDVFVKYKNEVIAVNYPETLEFFSILDSLVKKGLGEGDENYFFSYRKRTEKNNTIKSLQLKKDTNVYISSATAKTMCQFYNESKIGLSFKNILKSKKVFSIDTNLSSSATESYFPNDASLDKLINSILDDNGVEYDNSSYYSKKVTDLLNSVKYSQK